jgi:prolyl-tRNA synthetase
MAKELTSRSENYSQWYNDLVLKADLAENSAVRGCMVIKPYGYAIWGKNSGRTRSYVQRNRSRKCIFPAFYTQIIFEQRAEHVDGFAKECAV